MNDDIDEDNGGDDPQNLIWVASLSQ